MNVILIKAIKSAQASTIQWQEYIGFSPSVSLRATNFKVSSNRTTGNEILSTAIHWLSDSGITWKTV